MHLRTGLFSLLLCAGAASASAAGTNAPPIPVGAVLSMSGSTASYGHDILNGMQIALDEVNRQGVQGRQLALHVEDSQSETAGAISGFRKVVSVDKVLAVVASDTSTNTMAMAPLAQSLQVPLVAPAATAKEVTAVGDYVTKVCFSDDFQGVTMADYAYKKLGKRRVAVVYEASSDYSDEIAKVFRARFAELGGKIIPKKFSYMAKDKDFRSTLLKIRRENPDAIFLPGYYGEVAVFLRQAHQMGLNVPVLGADGWDSPNLQQLMGSTPLDSFVSSHYASDAKEPRVQAFVAEFKRRHGVVPGTMSALAYDALMVLAEAMRRAPKLTSEAIKKSINETVRYAGVSGSISIDSQGQTTKTGTIMRVTNQGNFFAERVVPDGMN